MNKESEYLKFKNRSFTYLAPMLGEHRRDFKNLVNTFIGDKEKEEEKDRILMLIKITKHGWFNEHVKFLTSLNYFESYYKVEDKYIMFKYKIDGETDLKNYRNFLKGKYSNLTHDYKKKILYFHTLEKFSEVAKVLYRAEEKYEEMEKLIGQKIPRTQDIGQLPNKDLLTFDNNKLLEEK